MTNETMKLRQQECLFRVPVLPSSRRDDAIRRLFSPRPSPEAKATIAKRFKALRGKSHMTQERLGDVIGICRQSVNEIENRRVYPHYTTIDRFTELEKRHEEARGVTASLRKSFWR